jgi:hypothetical protein
VNIQNLGKYENVSSGVRDRVGNAYEKLAGSDDYQKNSNSLRIIQIAVVSLSAIATGYTNAIIHENRLGFWGAHGLAILVAFFVERFYFVLRHGLTTTYQSGKQRLYAMACYRIIQATMILNCAILTMWIAELPVPPWLEFWNHWSLCVHFGLALLGVQSVRDSDAAIENRMLELKAECARQDLVTLRKAAAIGSPLALAAAKLRGLFDAIALSCRLLFSKGGFSKKYIDQINQVAAEQFGHLDALPQPTQTQSFGTQRRPGFVQNQNPPSGGVLD